VSGAVVVTTAITPGWASVMSTCAAVVTEIGGPLSHSSTIAREFGIPAVMGVPNATRKIRDGQTITVDGGAGVVHVH
jgi:pyruvate,water dikinase